MDTNYYTPDISDFKVGYEFEMRFKNNKDWESIVFESTMDLVYIDDIINQRIGDKGGVRVPYLTEQQIEDEGWKFQAKSIDMWFNKEGNFQIGNDNTPGTWTSYKIVLHYGFHDKRLFIHADDMGSEHKLFEGECKSINEFRIIFKLLNI